MNTRKKKKTGHPEFSPDIVLKIIAIRQSSRVISDEIAEESKVFARERDEGVSCVGKVWLELMMMMSD